MINSKRKAYFLLISFFYLFNHPISGQDQKVADSLAKVYKADTARGVVQMELLRKLAFNEARDLKLGLRYADELITLSTEQGNFLYLHRGYFQKGNIKRLMGDLDEALAALIKSIEAAHKANYAKGEGNAYGAVADIYAVSNNHPNARLYYAKAIATLRLAGDSISLASAISNSGDEYLNNHIYDSALLCFREAEKIFADVNYEIGKAYCQGNIGMVYANIGENELAERNINEAITILQQSEDYYPICVYLISMSDIYQQKGDNKAALSYAMRSLQLAQQYGLKEQISDANLKLSQLYEAAGNPNESLKYYKNYITYRDSVNDIKSVQKMADLRTDYEVSQKQVEVDLLNQQTRTQRIINLSLFIILGLGVIILGTLYWYYRAISREKKRSESLLLNILPAETAKELKRNGKVDAVKFDEVTVLFTDFVQFTKVAEHQEPEQLVKSIDFYFKAFDEIGTKHGLEKIKTIGDSYMCACGLPMKNKTHARNVANAASEMIGFVNREMNATDGLSHFEIRIGIHTGPVVAGIVGIKKWQYDIWGDTVNIASRMESNSKPGKINLSETTYQQIKNEFSCEYRGEIEVKNHGSMKMYFLQ
ncbi:MAG TPA: adenylate/guanylate cyclase domain-containing protein [Chitinophagaceae bacterium]|nr:adenylate/guanylate cyclase domain-containing protein [Chitinophagaceae bacterium]